MSFPKTDRPMAQSASGSIALRRLGLIAAGVAFIATTIATLPADARSRKKRAKAAAVVEKSIAPDKATGSQALPPADPFPEDSPTKTQLSAGALTVTLTAADAGATLPVGGSAVVTLAIEAGGGNRSATILAESEGGEILGITGGDAEVSPIRGGLSAEIRLPASGAANLAIEMGLKGGARGADGQSRNRMRVTLLPQRGGKDESVLAWGLADCAGDYHAELQKIIGSRRDRMLPALEAAIAADPDISGKWMFPGQNNSPLLICKGAKGRKIAACTGATAANTKDVPDAEAAWDEAQVVQLASAVLATKGALPGFQKRPQPLRQVSFTLLNSMKNYMEQVPHPALCTGVEGMIGYYRDRTPNLRNTIASVKSALPAAQKLAIAKVAELGLAPAAANTGSGVISAAVAAEPASSYSAVDLVDQIGKAVLNATDGSETAAIKDLAPKLEHMRALMDGPTTADLAADKRTTALAALRLIEANRYIATAARKYADLDEAVYGTMSAVADAHKARCTCQ